MKTITSLSCTGKGVVSAKGIEKLMSLTELSIGSNKLTKLDASKNTSLTHLNANNNQLTSLDVSKNMTLTSSKTNISFNPYSEILYVYKGGKTTVGNNVKLLTQLGWDSPTWTSNNTNIATVDNNGIVTTLASGSVQIKGIVSDKYTTTSTINIVEITSDKYEINEENSYILIGYYNDSNIIKNNISVLNENVTIDVHLDNYKLYFKYKDEVLKEFKLIGYTSSKYDLSKGYIYVVNNELNTEDININNGSTSIKDNKLLIKYDNKIIDEYKIVSIRLIVLVRK